jgi:hypothetical protein
MGQKMVRFAQLGAARSRQAESIEVGDVGSKRPSSGGNGGHVVSLYPLTWRSLPPGLLGGCHCLASHLHLLSDRHGPPWGQRQRPHVEPI